MEQEENKIEELNHPIEEVGGVTSSVQTISDEHGINGGGGIVDGTTSSTKTLININKPEEQEETRDGRGRFKPGMSGNPGGRPNEISITRIVRKALDEIPVGENKTYAALIVEGILRDAKRGDAVMRKLVWNYMDGMPKNSIDFTGDKETLEMLTNILKGAANKDDTEQSGQEGV